MRHIIVATTMLAVALVVTFTAATVLQGVAIANGRANNEPYVLVEAAKPAPAASKLVGSQVGSKERLTSQYRDRSVSTAAQVGL